MLFGRTLQASFSLDNRPFVLDVSRLREDERLELKYDKNKNLIAIQKVKLSLLREPMEARAETDIAPGGIGQVFYQGSYWKARCDGETQILKGQTVHIIARYELTLLVIPGS